MMLASARRVALMIEGRHENGMRGVMTVRQILRKDGLCSKPEVQRVGLTCENSCSVVAVLMEMSYEELRRGAADLLRLS